MFSFFNDCWFSILCSVLICCRRSEKKGVKSIICKTFFTISQSITAVLLCNRLWPFCKAAAAKVWQSSQTMMFFKNPANHEKKGIAYTLWYHQSCGNILYKVTYNYFIVALTIEDKFMCYCVTWFRSQSYHTNPLWVNDTAVGWMIQIQLTCFTWF